MEYRLFDGTIVLIDREDLTAVAGYRWTVYASGGRKDVRAYIKREGKTACVLMHVLLMRPPKGYVVAFRNGNKLDLRRANMVIVRRGAAAVEGRGPVSGARGVYRTKHGKYSVRFRVRGKLQYFGTYSTIEEAAKVYDREVRRHFSHVRTNATVRRERRAVGDQPVGARPDRRRDATGQHHESPRADV